MEGNYFVKYIIPMVKHYKLSVGGNMKQLILLLVVSVFLVGCATTVSLPKSVLYDSAKIYPATNPAIVKIFQLEPPQKYIKIGEIELNSPEYGSNAVGDILAGPTNNWGTDTSITFEKKIKEEAAKMGGDAIIVLKDTSLGIRDDGEIKATSSIESNGTLRTEGRISGPKTYGRQLNGVVIKFE